MTSWFSTISFGLPSAIFCPWSSTTMCRATAMIARITCSTMTMVRPRCDKLADQRDRLIDLRRVEPGHDLVEQQQPRLRRQRARHFQPPLVDGREIPRRRVFLGRKADELDRLAGFLAGGIGMLVAQERAGHDIGQHRHRAKRSCDLKRARQAERADVMRPQADDLAAEGGHRAGVGPIVAGDQIESSWSCRRRWVRSARRFRLPAPKS